MDRQAINGFAEVPQANGIVIDQLSQTKEAMPPDEDNGEEKEVVMSSMAIVCLWLVTNDAIF